MTIHVVLIDDHHMVRAALRDAINQESGLHVVAEAGDSKTGLAAILSSRPQVVVLDIALPDASGIDLAREILRNVADVRIVALSGYKDRIFVEEMFKAGAHAYVAKSASTEELFRAIYSVHQGNRYVSEEIASLLVSAVSSSTGAPPPASVLSFREREVLRLLAEGMRAKDIAKVLGTSMGTVEVHRRNIKNKVGIRTTAELTRYAIREGLTAG